MMRFMKEEVKEEIKVIAEKLLFLEERL